MVADPAIEAEGSRIDDNIEVKYADLVKSLNEMKLESESWLPKQEVYITQNQANFLDTPNQYRKTPIVGALAPQSTIPCHEFYGHRRFPRPSSLEAYACQNTYDDNPYVNLGRGASNASTKDLENSYSSCSTKMADKMSELAWTESLKTQNIGASIMNTEEESLYNVSRSSATETYLDYYPGKSFKEERGTPVDSERMSLDYLVSFGAPPSTPTVRLVQFLANSISDAKATKGGRNYGLGASVGTCDRHMSLDSEIESPLMDQLPAFDTPAQRNTELPKVSHKEDLAMCDSGWSAIALSNTERSKISFRVPIGGPAETMGPEPRKGPSQTRPLAALAASRQVPKNCKKTSAQLRLRTSLEAIRRNAGFQGHSSGLESSAPLLPPYPPNLTKPRKGEVWIEDIGAESKAQADVTSFESPSEDWEVVEEMEGYEQDERDWAAVKELDRDIPKC